jgi:hypothetical protein
LDYQVSFKNVAAASYTVFATQVTATTITVTGLTAGIRYRFVVQSRNAVGLSLESVYVDVLAAQKPDAPTALQNAPLVTRAD